jgi:hypothetical protein
MRKEVSVNRPRAADDFEVIRERLEELRREREEFESTDKRTGTAAEDGDGSGESGGAAAQQRASGDGAPTAWMPTIFLPQPTD